MIFPINEILEGNWLTGRDIGNGDGLVEPEGAAVDVRLGEIWEMDTESDAFLGKTTRKTREYTKVATYEVDNTDNWFELLPNKYYQFKTIETMDVPNGIVARFVARYNILANGIMVLGYKADPGYQGPFVVPIINLSGVPFKIEMGARFAQFEFHRIDGDGVMYRGQWKGGRVFTKEEETQV